MIALEEAKGFLDVIHDADDAKLQLLLDGAIDEALSYMNIGDASEVWPDEVPASVKVGVLLLLQASYQSSPEDLVTLRTAAEVKLRAYREMVGL